MFFWPAKAIRVVALKRSETARLLYLTWSEQRGIDSLGIKGVILGNSRVAASSDHGSEPTNLEAPRNM